MFPNVLPGFKLQKGFLVPLAAFIVVGIAALAIAISRFGGQNTMSTTQEGLSIQAFYAADSGAQYGMSSVFFSATDRAATDTNCLAVNGASLSFSVSGLSLCSAMLTCSIANDSANTTSFYTIRSAATCGTSDIFAERTIAVSAFMQ